MIETRGLTPWALGRQLIRPQEYGFLRFGRDIREVFGKYEIGVYEIVGIAGEREYWCAQDQHGESGRR